ncbi:MAG: thioesterase [Rhodospirillaceae bacterium]|nr:MAG: thioesterase [Rhodospirillaceae bacterium]
MTPAPAILPAMTQDIRMTDAAIDTPFVSTSLKVQSGWIDNNGHMNVAFYPRAFDLAFDEVYVRLAIGQEMVSTANTSTFASEMHLTFQGEVFEGDPLRITTQLVGLDAKKFHWFQAMYHGEKGYLAATCEWMILFVDMIQRRVSTMPDDVKARLEQVLAAHSQLPPPPEVGRFISMQNRRRAG